MSTVGVAFGGVEVRVAVGEDPDADVVASSTAEAARLGAAASSDAAVALALLLRGFDGRSVWDGLVAESATYSMLQGSSGFQAWLADRAGRTGRPARPGRPDRRPGVVAVERDGDVLTLTLDRPEVRNAYDAATRDALLEALAVAEADPGVRVVLRGEGPSFCSGGDLDEFGTATDPAAAHRVRLAASVGWALHRLADRVEARVHGACVGSGIELPAFAGRVVARRDARFSLPELAMGLIPGAGGTVSLPRRIGRQRTMWLALTGAPIDAATALDWGLVDEVDPRW